MTTSRSESHLRAATSGARLSFIQSPRPTCTPQFEGIQHSAKEPKLQRRPPRTRISSLRYLDKCEGPRVKYGRFNPLTAPRPFNDGLYRRHCVHGETRGASRHVKFIDESIVPLRLLPLTPSLLRGSSTLPLAMRNCPSFNVGGACATLLSLYDRTDGLLSALIPLNQYPTVDTHHVLLIVPRLRIGPYHTILSIGGHPESLSFITVIAVDTLLPPRCR